MDQVPQVKCCDPRIPDGAEGAPGRVEQEVAAHRELPGEDRVRTAGVFGHQDVGVEQGPVDQVAPLGAGVDKPADATFTSREDPAEDQDPPPRGCSSSTAPYLHARKSRAWLSTTR